MQELKLENEILLGTNLFLKWVQMGLSWLLCWKLHNCFIKSFQLCKYNLNETILGMTKSAWKNEKIGRKVAEFNIDELYSDEA